MSNPTGLLGGNGPFGTLLSSLPAADQFEIDIDALTSDFSQPCNISSDFGDFISDICDSVDTVLEDAINAIDTAVAGIETVVNDIDTVVDDIDSAITGLVSDLPNQLQGVLDDAETFATTAANDALSSAETFATSAASSVCNSANSVFTSIKDVSISLGSIPKKTLFDETIVGVRIKVEFPAISLGKLQPFSFLSTLIC